MNYWVKTNLHKGQNKMNQPILTIIIAAYSHVGTIERAIKSVLEQETNFDFIIHIFDDCSTDGTIKICEDYAKKYPEKILFTTQTTNTKGQHLYEAFLKIRTPFWTALDGDDYWCNKQKLQMSVDVLNVHPECSVVAHNFIYEYVENNTQTVALDLESDKIFTFTDAPYFHTSTRVYRNVVDFAESNLFQCCDTPLLYQYFDKGNLYYINKTMSVYSITGEGVWSSLTSEEQNRGNYKVYYLVNSFYKFKYDEYFTGCMPKKLKLYKLLFGKKLGWKIYLNHKGVKISKDDMVFKK